MLNVENKNMFTGLGYVAALVIGGFAVFRLFRGDFAMALLDALLASGILILSLYIHISGRIEVARYAGAVVAVLGTLATQAYNPQSGILWIYVATIGLYYILPLSAATFFSLGLLGFSGWLMFSHLHQMIWTPLVITLAMVNVFSYMFARNAEDQQADLQQLSVEDELTGVGNRRAFADKAREALSLYGRCHLKASLIYVDLDRFKWINDNLGHARGDSILKSVVACIKLNLRTTDTLFRIGGDEFLILAEGADQHQAVVMAERLRQDIEARSDELGHGVTLSLGVAEICQGDSRESWMARADMALYRAKEAGRNRVSTAPPVPAKTTVDAGLA